jgi:hypothetical protein
MYNDTDVIVIARRDEREMRMMIVIFEGPLSVGRDIEEKQKTIENSGRCR